MNDIQNRPDGMPINDSQVYKKCYGLHCNKIAKRRLRILYINKSGWFCDDCSRDLIDLDLGFDE